MFVQWPFALLYSFCTKLALFERGKKKKLLLCVEVKVLCLSNKCKQADKVNVSMKCGTAMPFAMRLDYVILHFEGKPRI